MEIRMDENEMYRECLQILQARHGDAKYYLVPLRAYVKATIKAETLLDQVLSDEATIQHTNKAGHTNNASNPKVRMWALFNEQAMKLGKDLGLNLHQGKVGRPAKSKEKKGFDLGPMKVAK